MIEPGPRTLLAQHKVIVGENTQPSSVPSKKKEKDSYQNLNKINVYAVTCVYPVHRQKCKNYFMGLQAAVIFQNLVVTVATSRYAAHKYWDKLFFVKKQFQFVAPSKTRNCHFNMYDCAQIKQTRYNK